MFRAQSLVKNLARAFFVTVNGGENCAVCGCKTLFYPLCSECLKEKFSVDALSLDERCCICGKELLSTDRICLQCREKSVLMHTDFVIPIFSYRLWNKELMFLWKSEGIRTLSRVFARIIRDVLIKIEVNVIVPVPPRPGKIQKKGWDQIDELAAILKYRYGFKVVPLLERHSDLQQKKLARDERLGMIGKSYFLRKEKQILNALKDFEGFVPLKACILDDVLTTGSTIENCAALLKKIGIPEVCAVTLFVVD